LLVATGVTHDLIADIGHRVAALGAGFESGSVIGGVQHGSSLGFTPYGADERWERGIGVQTIRDRHSITERIRPALLIRNACEIDLTMPTLNAPLRAECTTALLADLDAGQDTRGTWILRSLSMHSGIEMTRLFVGVAFVLLCLDIGLRRRIPDLTFARVGIDEVGHLEVRMSLSHSR
jgi:hypothetical protein